MKKYTLQKEISKTFMIVLTFTLLITMIVTSTISVKVYWNKSYQLCEQLVRLNLNLLNNQIIEIQKTQENIAGNSVVKEAVSYYSQQKEKDYVKELQYRRALDDVFYMFAESSDVSGAHIVDKEGHNLYSYKESLKIGYNMLDEQWYRTLTESVYMDTCFVSGLHDREYLVNTRDEQCISIIMPIQIQESYTFFADAFLICDIAIDSIVNNGGNEEDMQFAILDSSGDLYYEDSLTLSTRERERIAAASKTKDTYVEALNHSIFSNSIVVSMKSQVFGWKVIGIKKLQEISDLTLTLCIILSIAIMVAILLVLFLSNRVARSIMLPMNLLIDECNRVASGDYSVEFGEKKSEEVSFLSDTIREMVDNIVQLTEKVVEEEKQLSDERMRVLQHQINPHFLNNVLQTIKALAVAGGTDRISRMSTLLGHILAYSVYEPYQNVALKVEMEYLKNYVELQNIRYENRIIYSIDCEEAAVAVPIPKLTLQPLVENSIEHGYKEKNKIIINISAEVEPDMVCIIISDNGEGINEKELENLRRRLNSTEVYNQKSSVGIVNVNARLKKIFGDAYGVQIFSKNQGGTTVIIRIPKMAGD